MTNENTAPGGPDASGISDVDEPTATLLLEPSDVAHLVARVVASPGGGSRFVHSPQTGAPIASVPRSTLEDVFLHLTGRELRE